MPGRIEREGALNYDVGRYIPQLIVAHALIGPWMGGQNDGLPTEPGRWRAKLIVR